MIIKSKKIKIYQKHRRSPLLVLEVESDKLFNEIYSEINSEDRFLRIKDIIISKDIISNIEFVE